MVTKTLDHPHYLTKNVDKQNKLISVWGMIMQRQNVNV